MRLHILGITIVCTILFLAPVVAAAGTDKTLVAWVRLENLDQRGGSVLTIQSGDQFDGIVFGELVTRRWMAGSNFFRRTERNQDDYAPETADVMTTVAIAVVYQGHEIRVYRNGRLYATHQAKNIDLIDREENIAVFGLRHVGAATGGHFSGAIDDARVYDVALSVDQLRSLQPNRESDIAPHAWWDFEGSVVRDRAGHFAHSQMSGGAKLDRGQLVLKKDSVLIAAHSEEAAKKAIAGHVPAPPYVQETPAMPDDIPPQWLTYHLAHPGPGVGMPGDPNCAFYYKGRYHLHYIYRNKHGFAFAHVSSSDMVHWNWHPTVLVGPNTGHGMFSGTGFFTKEGQPAIIYHGQGAAKNFIALALDDNLDEWTKPVAVVARTADGKDVAMRYWDPDCWLNGDTYYAISGGGPPHLIKSPDLKHWSSLGLLLHDNMPDLGISRDEDVSCANMFKIGDKWMLLCISHKLGCRYYLGKFRDEKYLPDFHAMMNWKEWNFFAPESLLAADGRRVMWAWCRVEGAQSAIQSLPRELSLPDDGVLRMKPLRELESLRFGHEKVNNLVVRNGESHLLQNIKGDRVELNVTISPTEATAYGIRVFCDEQGNGFPVTIRPESKSFAMGDIEPPFTLQADEELRMRVFLDKGMVEVFLNDRQAAVYMAPHLPEDVGIRLFSQGGDLRADVEGWKMRSIYGK